jgi:hypothetical protein
MEDLSFASEQTKVYRMNLAYRIYHFVVGAAFLVCAALCYPYLFLSVLPALFSAFMITRPLLAAVIVDEYSVTVKSTFSARSLQRSSITAIERLHTGKENFLVLWSDPDKEGLKIGDIFAFDEAWYAWLSTYRDLSDDKPLSLF